MSFLHDPMRRPHAGKPAPWCRPPEPRSVAGVSHALAPDPWPVAPDPWPVAAWCAGRGPCYLVRAWWPELRRPGPRAVLPGARPGAPGAWCAAPDPGHLVADPWPPARAPWWPPAVARAPGGVRPGAWPPVPGPGPLAAGARPPAAAPGPKKRPRSRLTKALARFYAVSRAPNSFTGPYPRVRRFHVKPPVKQAPFDQLVNSCENFSQFKSK
jgi:hypothetical protein